MDREIQISNMGERGALNITFLLRIDISLWVTQLAHMEGKGRTATGIGQSRHLDLASQRVAMVTLGPITHEVPLPSGPTKIGVFP